jgi:arabinofuranan 3-O-arabinosyltransferase
MNSERRLLQSWERDLRASIVTGAVFRSATDMAGTWKRPIRRAQQALVSPRVRQIVRRAGVRYLLAWLLALVTTGVCVALGWYTFETPERNDYRPPGGPLFQPSGRPWGGNAGHTMIDFGGQWLMGRLLREGHARDLYNRNAQRQILYAAFPVEDEDPWPTPEDQPPRRRDAEMFMYWLMGYDNRIAQETFAACATPAGATDALTAAVLLAAGEDAWGPDRVREVKAKQVGGPLYPPINAFLNYPLAFLAPLPAYRVHQCVSFLLGFLAALAVTLLTRGRIWFPIALTAILAYPGFISSVQLGQNAVLTLNILLWGWLLLCRGQPVAGGMIWGLLAYKPVWALAFFLVPLLTQRWRFCLAMLATGTALGLLTLPVVGVGAWLDWLQVGRLASNLYDVDKNWIFLSRDVLSIPRRWLLEFTDDNRQQRMDNWQLPMLYGWALLLGILEVTVRFAVLWRTGARAVRGPGAAFLLLGAWLACYHFMYYDVLLTALPVCLLFTEPRRYLERIPVVVGAAGDDAAKQQVWLLNRMVPTLLLLVALTGNWLQTIGFCPIFGTPWDTFCLMALWMWCGWRWLRDGEETADTELPAVEPVQKELVAEPVLTAN